MSNEGVYHNNNNIIINVPIIFYNLFTNVHNRKGIFFYSSLTLTLAHILFFFLICKQENRKIGHKAKEEGTSASGAIAEILECAREKREWQQVSVRPHGWCGRVQGQFSRGSLLKSIGTHLGFLCHFCTFSLTEKKQTCRWATKQPQPMNCIFYIILNRSKAVCACVSVCAYVRLVANSGME